MIEHIIHATDLVRYLLQMRYGACTAATNADVDRGLQRPVMFYDFFNFQLATRRKLATVSNSQGTQLLVVFLMLFGVCLICAFAWWFASGVGVFSVVFVVAWCFGRGFVDFCGCSWFWSHGFGVCLVVFAVAWWFARVFWRLFGGFPHAFGVAGAALVSVEAVVIVTVGVGVVVGALVTVVVVIFTHRPIGSSSLHHLGL